MRRLTTPITLVAAALTVAGGAIHLREWLHTYRHVPSAVPGSFVVKVGFPINAVTSVVIAVALVYAGVWARHLLPFALAAAAGFEAASLASLILSRVGDVLGWRETAWTPGAEQTRAVEIGALVAIALVALLLVRIRRTPTVALATA
ncbi:MAG: hypothetical protein QOJ55_1738 [Solirubrobacteraceae bacterium]|nr:hypothetical protein [Solirubrobacteraceae bacterium]